MDRKFRVFAVAEISVTTSRILPGRRCRLVFTNMSMSDRKLPVLYFREPKRYIALTVGYRVAITGIKSLISNSISTWRRMFLAALALLNDCNSSREIWRQGNLAHFGEVWNGRLANNDSPHSPDDTANLRVSTTIRG